MSYYIESVQILLGISSFDDMLFGEEVQRLFSFRERVRVGGRRMGFDEAWYGFWAWSPPGYGPYVVFSDVGEVQITDLPAPLVNDVVQTPLGPAGILSSPYYPAEEPSPEKALEWALRPIKRWSDGLRRVRYMVDIEIVGYPRAEDVLEAFDILEERGFELEDLARGRPGDPGALGVLVGPSRVAVIPLEGREAAEIGKMGAEKRVTESGETVLIANNLYPLLVARRRA